MKKAVSITLCAVMAAGIISAFPANALAKIDMNNLPEPVASSASADAKRFVRTKPVLTGGDPYDYGGSGRCLLSWEPVDNALFYRVYYQPDSAEKASLFCETFDTSAYVYYYEDTIFRVKAVTYNMQDKMLESLFSNSVELEIPDRRRPQPYYEYGYTTEAAGSAVYADETNDYYGSYNYESYDADIYYEEVEYDEASEPVLYGANAPSPAETTEEYGHAEESGFKKASSDPVSTFSADVDTASYTNVRRMIEDGSSVPAEAVRAEEFINYFDYDYPAPDKGETISIYTETAPCPWNSNAQLLMTGISAESITQSETPDSNLVFLIDTSGSMYSQDKLPLAVKSLNMVMDSLDENDRVSIVTYSGEERVILAGAGGNMKNAVEVLTGMLDANGSTNGESGINAAYELAEKYYIEGGSNRIILVTDGDLNVGIQSEEELTEFISKKRENSGVYFSVLGFGTGNIKDNKMEALADNGNGSYHYIDSASEAARVLSKESGNLYTAAEDVKIQVEFNPAAVSEYRLIGYDNRRLNNEDFDNDQKDAGEMGSGQTVTALYEIIPADGSAGTSKYTDVTEYAAKSGELATVSVRYKKPGESKSRLVTNTVIPTSGDMSKNMRKACAAAEFALVLSDSQYKGNASIGNALELLENNELDSDGTELRQLMEAAAGIYKEPAELSKLLPDSIVSMTCAYTSYGDDVINVRLTKQEAAVFKSRFESLSGEMYITNAGISIPEGKCEEWDFEINGGQVKLRFVNYGRESYLIADGKAYLCNEAFDFGFVNKRLAA